MVGKNNNFLKDTKQGTRIESYSIKKFKVGAASVVIGASIFFAGGGLAQASEEVAENAVTENTFKVTEPKTSETDLPSTESKEVVKPSVKPVTTKEEVSEAVAKKVETHVLDKSKLEALISEIDNKIALGSYSNKTEDSVNVLLNELTSAKITLASASTQAELDKAYSKLVTTVNSKLVSKKVEKPKEAKVETSKVESPKTETKPVVNKNKAVSGQSGFRSADEGYTSETEAKSSQAGDFAHSMRRSYQTFGPNSEYKVFINGYQSTGEDVLAGNYKVGYYNAAGDFVDERGGRVDIPLSKTEADKLTKEAPMWAGKFRPTNSKLRPDNFYGANGTYEFLTTEIYGYTYEQGKHYAYIKDVKKRFELSDEAKAAGYTIKDVAISNLPPGMTYNAKTDTAEGYISSKIQNGVYDMRYEVTIQKDGEAPFKSMFKDLKAGWIGWQDTSAPRLKGDSFVTKVGEEVNKDISFTDENGMDDDKARNYKLAKYNSTLKQWEETIEDWSGGASSNVDGSNKVAFTLKDGSRGFSENNADRILADTRLNGVFTRSKENATGETSISDLVPGLTYTAATGEVSGIPTETGIFTAAAFAKDYNNETNSNNNQWSAYGQEAHTNITIAVAPKITVQNINAYDELVTMKVSSAASGTELVMPDGTITNVMRKNGKWVVGESTTNTAVKVGEELGEVDTSSESTINVPITRDASRMVGTDSIIAKAKTSHVKAYLQRDIATVKDAKQQDRVATFNHGTGKYELPEEEAYELKTNTDGTSTLIERRVYTNVKPDGETQFIVYEFERTWDVTSDKPTLVEKIADIRKRGAVKAVGDVTRTVTTLGKDQTKGTSGMIVTVTYDPATDTWTSSDGTAVTAEKLHAGWSVSTASGFKGYVAYREVTSVDTASIANEKPTSTSESYSRPKGATVDLYAEKDAKVRISDETDDSTPHDVSVTRPTRITVTTPNGTVKIFDSARDKEKAYIDAIRNNIVKENAYADLLMKSTNYGSELNSKREHIDRLTKLITETEESIHDLKLRTISESSEKLLQDRLAEFKANKAQYEKEVADGEVKVNEFKEKLKAALVESKEADTLAETARTELKSASEALLNEVKAYTLAEKGLYKVNVRGIDSNGVVVDAEVGGDNTGTAEEDAVTDTTYYIAVVEDKHSSGVRGSEQSKSIKDAFPTKDASVSNHQLVDPTTGQKSNTVVTEQGTYTIDADGLVKFTPKDGFVGTANGIDVVADVTVDGKVIKAQSKYTLTVYGVESSNDETTGNHGELQKSKDGRARFNELNTRENTPNGTNVKWDSAKYKLVGANDKGEIIKDGIGKYAIDGESGIVTFTPVPEFAGIAPKVEIELTVNAVDEDGNNVEVKSTGDYQPTVNPETRFKDKEGNEIKAKENGTVDKEDIPEYRFVETKKLPNGDTEHIYEKVNTFFKDKDGNEIKDKETGTVDKANIPEYRFVETKKLPNGDTEHVYEKVSTFFKDKDGNEIKDKETGTVDKVNIPEYRFVETKKLPNGDTEHIYEKVTTFFKDKDGNEIKDKETGTVDKSDIPEYRFVETKKLPNGDTEHIYEKVSTFFKDKDGNEIKDKETGTVDKSDIPEYRFVETKKLPNGDTEQVYEKVSTFFEDKDGNEIKDKETGTVGKSDIPEYRFVETKKLPNGDTEHIYEKVTTYFKDKDGNEIKDKESGTVDKANIPEYRFVETKKLENGDTEHVYEKVSTFFKDKDGNEIRPKESGSVEKKDIPEYRFVETKKLENGDVEHIYEKVSTFFKDKDGNEVSSKESGNVGKKDIPEYRFVESKVDKDGNTTHIYEKVSTFFKDKDGNEIVPKESGSVDKKDIPEYRFVETKKLENGDVEHIYEKITTYFKDKDGNEIVPKENGSVDKRDIPEYKFVETKVDKDGNTTHIYEKVTTFFKDKYGNEIQPKESGNVGKKDIPEYRFVETKVDKDGNITHIYEKVTTFFKDKDGNEIVPKESGSVGKKDIPEYRFVETKVDKDGNTTYIYEKVTTYFKDKDGNDIIPKESGSVEKKDIPEYRFVETKVDKDGNTTHIYEKVTTYFKDKDGNEIRPKESGSVDKRDIPEYRFVETKVDKDGNTTHIYEKVTTYFKDKDGNEIRPKESGSVDKKNIPEYRFVETKVDKDGNVTHVYEKVTAKEEPKKEELKQTPKKQESKKDTPKVQTKEQPAKVVEHKQLPNTGSTDTAYAGLGALLLGLFAGIRKRKKD